MKKHTDLRVVCFTLWFPIHSNIRYRELFLKLAPIIRVYKVTLSYQRIIRALQYRLWHILKQPIIHPFVLRYLSSRYHILFTTDPYQIPTWSRHKSVVVDMDDPLFSPVEVRLLNLPQVKAIVVTMERMKKIFQKLGVVQPIYVIPQGVTMEQTDTRKIEQIRQLKNDNDVIVGYHAPTLTLSYDGPWRARGGMDDLDFLFSTVEEIRKVEPRIKLWLLGEPSKSVKNYVANGRNSWIKLIPFLDILNYISNFDIAVYPRTKPDLVRFRVKIAEYMACGIPIVSTNVEEGPRIIIKEAKCGIICDSQEDFVRALVRLAQSAEMRQELGKAGQRYASENLDWSILAERYKQILSEV